MSRMWEPATKLDVSADDRPQLERWASEAEADPGLALRARIILMASEGLANNHIARQLGCSRPTVIQWRSRFMARGLAGIRDIGRPGRKKTIAEETVRAILEATRFERPADGGRWTTRTLAKRFRVSHMTVQRIWKAFNVKPDAPETWRPVPGQEFLRKVRSIVDLYFDPPPNRSS